MIEQLAGSWNYIIVVILMMTGLFMVIARANLVKKMIGLSIFQTSVFIFYISLGKMAGGTAPILDGNQDTLYSNPFTEALYHKFRVPLPMLRGVGMSFLPRPVQLTHELSGPFIPPEWTQDPAEDEALLMRFHNTCIQEMEELMRMAASHHHLPYSDNWENRPSTKR